MKALKHAISFMVELNFWMFLASSQVWDFRSAPVVCMFLLVSGNLMNCYYKCMAMNPALNTYSWSKVF